MTELNVDVPTETTEAIPTPGEMLRELREMQKLSHKDVADSLNLRPDIIEKLELNLFDEIGSPLFVRGYLKSCARLYGVDEQSVIVLYNTLTGAPKQAPVKMTSFSRRTKREAHDNRLMLATYVIVGIFIIFVVMWWWQRDNFSEAITSNIDDLSIAISEATDPDNMDDESTTPRIELTKSVIVNNERSEEPDESFNNEQNNELISSPSDIQASVPEENVTQVLKQTITPDDTPSKNNTPNVKTDSELVLTFSDDCWLIITDGDGNEVANGVKKKGYTMPIKGKSPFSFVLGAPANVNINFEGKDIDMTPFIKLGHVARFSLPMTEE
ncbi:RodZ domain-containing protein [Algibacillus agarilyticus]|uniref:RodZ domain-containing protein n=1 Tax=Algibacillus agarilyticus TaxID=2234133 RepID=UPI000DD0B2E5|nr:RodZ domain-containing protein [Algibacillus agarilyticus]